MDEKMSQTQQYTLQKATILTSNFTSYFYLSCRILAIDCEVSPNYKMTAVYLQSAVSPKVSKKTLTQGLGATQI